ncbi:carbohydrate kinase [Bacillus sp. AFS076308]|uniref:carbohydrate kinase family protein n=1 Tax=unclassified Bacillus (in: firmicutes) TaxID=185979 RepID=UPI000BF5590F|nr:MULTISPECIES: carbohydrate kinase [unclassified Bacillus (in: firmicutes)]PFO00916.1 carbohydrate kinase [Bacillus sp. AFS076308]PGV52555.1 carbohydrate kinase [Bacillus sp. AFS037270]
MFDVTALGEVLIDFTPAGKSESGEVQFERNAGGAPANVLAALAKLGKKTAFIGKVGNDQFGHYLHSALGKNGINTKGLVFSNEINTTLAFVHLDEQGDRSFSFYRNPGADMMLKEQEVNLELLDHTRIFHFGTISMTHEPAASATLMAIKYAKEKGQLISFDPNLRVNLWGDLSRAKEMFTIGLGYANVLKISEEELDFISGTKDPDKGTAYIYDQFHTELIFVTMGGEGCFYRLGEKVGKCSGYEVVSIDTTGAGDAFLAGILYQLIEKNQSLSDLSLNDVEEMASFANAVGALATTKKGAISAMPSVEEIIDLRIRQFVYQRRTES